MEEEKHSTASAREAVAMKCPRPVLFYLLLGVDEIEIENCMLVD